MIVYVFYNSFFKKIFLPTKVVGIYPVYLNESKLIITSMNLYEYSENNREMGVLIEKSVDNKVFKDVKPLFK